MAQYTPASSQGGYVNGSGNGSVKGYKPKPDVNPHDSSILGVTSGESGAPLHNSEDEKDALSEYNLVRMFSAVHETAKSHRTERDRIRKICWALYNNEYDWSEKAWWQHRAPIPKVRGAVDRAVALFRKTLLRMNPFYGMQAESKMGRTKGRFTMQLTDYWFDQSAIVDVLVDAFKVGLITSEAILKIWWMRVRDFKPEITTEQFEEITYEFGVPTGKLANERKKTVLKEYFKGKLGIAPVNPDNIWVVPGTHGRMVIERDQTTLNELEALAEIGVYDKKAVARLRDKLVNSTTIQEDTTPEVTKESVPTANTYLRFVDLWHFWGDIYDIHGRLVKCDASFTLANREVLIKPARDNPFYHKMPPYVIGTPYKVPFSSYNRGMIEDVAEIAKSITEMANLVADGALYDALKAFAIDVDQLDDPSEARQGLYPGKTFLRKSSNALAPNESLIQTVEVGKVPAEAMNMIGMYEKYMQEGSYINEWVGGTGGKGDRTLGEVNIKTQSALEGLDESARNLETTVIEPCLDMCARVIYQYHEEYNLPRLMDNYPKVAIMLQQLSPPERYFVMMGDFSFKVRGLSMMLDRQQKIGELKEVLQLLSYLPGFIERLNPDATLEEVLAPLGWDPQKLLLNPAMTSVTTPMAGAPPNQNPPAVPPGMPPAMETRNAHEGARMGGGTNNPMARGQVQQPGTPMRPQSGQMAAPMPQQGPPMQQGGGQPPVPPAMLNGLRQAIQFYMNKNMAQGAMK